MNTFICNICKFMQPEDYFYKYKQKGKSYRLKFCKKCHANKCNKDQYRTKIKEEITLQNATNVLFYRIKNRIGHHPYYKDIKLRFTREEMYKFLESDWPRIEKMYKKWKKNGFKVALAPSVDRIDNKGHYEIENIRIVTHSENCKATRFSRALKSKEHKRKISDSLKKYHAKRLLKIKRLTT